ncbi:ATP-binding protein [Streptomyces sp. NPDC093249]|uniref:ATP-binding protein n=1 Tax=unclassified Streptomyces TaxID=2593676 RepID=UPI003450415C
MTTGNGIRREFRPRVPRDAAEARARVAAVLTGRTTGAGGAGDGGVPSSSAVGDALLVTSELVTNAFRHGGGLTGFDVALGRAAVTISVADASDELPRRAEHWSPERAVELAEGGFGWPLVRLLALEVRLRLPPEGGKTIEVRLPLR